MDKQAQERHNTSQLQKLADKHGPEVVERIRAMVLKRAESFPDRGRDVVWIINVSDDGRDITLDVRP